jgi:hypothetical protein
MFAARTRPALTCQDLEVAQARGLGGADVARLDDGVLVRDVDVLQVAPHHPALRACADTDGH